jgi:hypothetical protein
MMRDEFIIQISAFQDKPRLAENSEEETKDDLFSIFIWSNTFQNNDAITIARSKFVHDTENFQRKRRISQQQQYILGLVTSLREKELSMVVKRGKHHRRLRSIDDRKTNLLRQSKHQNKDAKRQSRSPSNRHRRSRPDYKDSGNRYLIHGYNDDDDVSKCTSKSFKETGSRYHRLRQESHYNEGTSTKLSVSKHRSMSPNDRHRSQKQQNLISKNNEMNCHINDLKTIGRHGLVTKHSTNDSANQSHQFYTKHHERFSQRASTYRHQHIHSDNGYRDSVSTHHSLSPRRGRKIRNEDESRS